MVGGEKAAALAIAAAASSSSTTTGPGAGTIGGAVGAEAVSFLFAGRSLARGLTKPFRSELWAYAKYGKSKSRSSQLWLEM